MTNGMITKDGILMPGMILALWLQLRKRVGLIKAIRKPGMKFDTRAADAVFDEVRPIANELGILIYPHETSGQGFPLEDGTLAAVNLVIYCQAVEDGSLLQIAGFGLGADNQDKAGGKANTYAFKSALLESLLAQGQVDTDDTDTPIRGGVKRLNKTKSEISNTHSVGDVTEMFSRATTRTDYMTAREILSKMNPDDIVALRSVAGEAKTRCGVV